MRAPNNSDDIHILGSNLYNHLSVGQASAINNSTPNDRNSLPASLAQE